MKFRCTARFLQAFDRLDSQAQALVLKAMRGFKDSPRIPSRDARVIYDNDSRNLDDDIWSLPCGKGVQLTYSFLNEENEPDHFICVLRNVGRND
jgi:hypothetical protein